MAGFEAGGGPGVGALGPLAEMWRDVYRKAGAVAEQRTTDLLNYHVYVYHPQPGPTAPHTHYYTVQGLWRFTPDTGGAPDVGYFGTDTGSIRDPLVLAFNRTTFEAQIIPGVAGVLRPGDHLHVMAQNDLTRYARYTVRAPVEDAETTFAVPVTGVAAGEVEVDADTPCYVTFLLGGGPLVPPGAPGVLAQISDSGETAILLPDDAHTVIPFDHVDFDPYGFYDPGAPTRLTVPPGGAGWYRITAALPTDLHDAEGEPPLKAFELYCQTGGSVLHALAGVLPATISARPLYAAPAVYLWDGTEVELVFWHNVGFDGDVASSFAAPASLLLERISDAPAPDARSGG